MSETRRVEAITNEWKGWKGQEKSLLMDRGLLTLKKLPSPLYDPRGGIIGANPLLFSKRIS